MPLPIEAHSALASGKFRSPLPHEGMLVGINRGAACRTYWMSTMNFFLAAVLTASSVAATDSEVDGDWTLLTVEVNGKPVNAGHPVLSIENRRLQLEAAGDSPAIVLVLSGDHLVLSWDPNPPQPQLCCPYTPDQWARRFGDPTYSRGPDRWVIDPVSGSARLVPPMPCVWRIPPPPTPLGVFVRSKDRLAIQLLPSDGKGHSLLLVLEKTLPQPRKAP